MYPPRAAAPPPQPSAAISLAGRRPFFVGSLITSVIGGILLLVTEFAGYETWGENYVYSVSLWSSPSDFFMLLLLLIFLLYAAGVSLRGLLPAQTPLPRRMLNFALYGAVFVCVYSLLLGGALLLIAEAWEEDLAGWWPGAGFFGGFIGGGLTALLLWLALRFETSS